jgi:hypothetical protein
VLGGITIQAILQGTIAFVVGFALMLWNGLIRPYPLVGLVVLATVLISVMSRRR